MRETRQCRCAIQVKADAQCKAGRYAMQGRADAQSKVGQMRVQCRADAQCKARPVRCARQCVADRRGMEGLMREATQGICEWQSRTY
jgi:hypothetical protein